MESFDYTNLSEYGIKSFGYIFDIWQIYPRGGGTLQLKIRRGWLDSLGSEILVGKDILGFLKILI